MFQKGYIIASINWIALSMGVLYGQTAGLVGSLQKRDEGLDLGEGQISLIASTLTLFSFVGFGLAAWTSDKIGRKFPFIIFSFLTCLSCVILYFSTEMYQFMLSRTLAGLASGALYSLNMFVISEYSSPKQRVFCVNLVVIIFPAIGTGLGHIMGIFLHWRVTSLISLALFSLGLILPYFWLESPHWLASKGRFDACKQVFHKLHSSTLNSERELTLLIKLETTKLEVAKQTNCKPTLKKLLKVFRRKYLWDLLTLSLFLNGYLVASGKLIYSLLGSVIVEDITGAKNVFLFTFLIDGSMILGPCVSCLFIRKTPLRTMLFTSGFAANIILLIFSLCYYFRNGQSYFNVINMVLLAFYFVIINSGPYPVVETIYSEMFPLELKLYIYTISGGVLMATFSLSVFVMPYMVQSVGYHGYFLVNAGIMSLSLGYIWFKLPETRGKTLQEIETYVKVKSFDVEEVLSNEQVKALII